MLDEWLQLPDDETDAVVAEVTGEVALRREDGGVVTVNPFKADPKYLASPNDRLVQVVLGSHEYLLTAIEAWAGDAVMRYGLDAMFAFQSPTRCGSRRATVGKPSLRMRLNGCRQILLRCEWTPGAVRSWWSDTRASLERQLEVMRTDFNKRRIQLVEKDAERAAQDAEHDAVAAITLASHCVDAASCRTRAPRCAATATLRLLNFTDPRALLLVEGDHYPLSTSKRSR